MRTTKGRANKVDKVAGTWQREKADLANVVAKAIKRCKTSEANLHD
jgi:hypothetical protein